MKKKITKKETQHKEEPKPKKKAKAKASVGKESKSTKTHAQSSTKVGQKDGQQAEVQARKHICTFDSIQW